MSSKRSTKIKDLKYNKLEMQSYLQSNMTHEEKSVLTAIRSQCIRGIKRNFSHMHRLCQHCPLNCDNENPQLDTQEHLLVCAKLGGSNTDFDFIHASVVEQTHVVREYSRLMKRRATLVEGVSTTLASCCLPGASFLDQSDPRGAASITSTYTI